jgi:sulfite reductase (NADPH) flavoprotein alpha-component
MTVPVLPESAPFTPAQRAWLNGFFAGLLGLGAESGSAGHLNGNGVTTAAAIASSPADAFAVAEEEFPWHDPALPLEERLTLAEGRPLERKLMAAMAQLDCGACGYLCKTYSEAIVNGEEKDLKRCTPGGKETARKLKELVAAQGVATSSGAAMTSVVAGNGPVTTTTTANGAAMTSVVTKPVFNRSNPFSAKLIGTSALNGAGSKKETRHIMIDLSGSGMVYKPGDALRVVPMYCPE